MDLLDEPNEEIFVAVRDKIYTYGPAAIPILEHVWENSFDPFIQHRIEEIIHAIEQDELKRELKNWSQFKNHDLLLGYLLVSRFQYPDLDQEMLIKKIGQISQDVWLELNNNLTGLEKIKVINHILFEVYKFAGNVTNIQAPENYYIKNLLEHQKGTPLSLGMIYVIIAQSLNIPIYGVDLPRHFVLAYMDDPSRELKDEPSGDVLFYINPFNKGAVFTRNEIELFVKQLGLDNKDSYYLPCSNKTIIRRLINELIFVYNQSGNPAKADELKDLLDIMD